MIIINCIYSLVMCNIVDWNYVYFLWYCYEILIYLIKEKILSYFLEEIFLRLKFMLNNVLVNMFL